MEFNWDEQGVFILENICPELTRAVHQEIEEVMNLTSMTIGGKDTSIDTKNFRSGIKVYTELILGMYNHDFKYNKMNKFLVISNKIFIKNIVCYPNRITHDDLFMLRSRYSYEEIYHLIMVTAFHKSKAQLSYISKSYDELRKQFD